MIITNKEEAIEKILKQETKMEKILLMLSKNENGIDLLQALFY